MAGERDAVRPAAWDGFGFFRGTQSSCALRPFSDRPPGRFLPRFPALPGCASWHIHAAAFGAFLCVDSDRQRGMAGVRGAFGESGALRARGQGSACGASWERAEPAAGDEFGIFRGIDPMLRLLPLPCSIPGRSRPRLRRTAALWLEEVALESEDFRLSLGGRGVDGSGQGNARGMGWVRVFPGEFNQAAPCVVSLPGLPADPGRAFQRFPAVPHGTSILCFPALRCRTLGTSLPPFGASPRFGLGRWRRGGSFEYGALRAGGQGRACGAAGEWPLQRHEGSGFASFGILEGPIRRGPGSIRWLVNRLCSEADRGPRAPTRLPWKHGRAWGKRDPRHQAQLLRGRP